jgi:hypothetical protein
MVTEKVPGDDLHHLSGNMPFQSAPFAAMDQDGLQQVEAISADHLVGRMGAVVYRSIFYCLDIASLYFLNSTINPSYLSINMSVLCAFV